jgi:hypothetical protein
MKPKGSGTKLVSSWFWWRKGIFFVGISILTLVSGYPSRFLSNSMLHYVVVFVPAISHLCSPIFLVTTWRCTIWRWKKRKFSCEMRFCLVNGWNGVKMVRDIGDLLLLVAHLSVDWWRGLCQMSLEFWFMQSQEPYTKILMYRPDVYRTAYNLFSGGVTLHSVFESGTQLRRIMSRNYSWYNHRNCIQRFWCTH